MTRRYDRRLLALQNLAEVSERNEVCLRTRVAVSCTA